MIKTVIKILSGEVMVFDAGGEQLPAYQGVYEEVREAILRDAAPGAAFFHWFDCADKPAAISKERW